MQSLSVVIIAQDEERTIGKVLASVKEIASEIVLVDSGSTDKTIEIAEQNGARVISQKWLGFSAQKNFAMIQATADWILSLDADEILTNELVAEIKETLSSKTIDYDGFRIARLMFVGADALAHGGFYPDKQLRLFRRGMGKFNDRLVHESVVLDGRVSDLRNHLLHMSYRDVSHFKSAHEKYARLAAKESLRSGYKKSKASVLNLLFHPYWTFFYRYFLRMGFLDGGIGLKMNLAYSDYVRKKISYLREEVRNSKELS